jgi:hypothetical protein
MIEGSYLHALILEPDTIKDRFEIIEVSSRNTKIYKEAVLEHEGKDLLLKAEADNMDRCVEKLLGSWEVCNLIRGEGVVYEEPAIKNIMGNWWKGKRDIGSDITVDIKTTSDIQKFRNSAYRYCYDSQAYVYQQLFDAPVVFIPIDKVTHQVGIYYCSNEFYDRGQEKVRRATEVYNKYFREGSTEDVNDFIIEDTL